MSMSKGESVNQSTSSPILTETNSFIEEADEKNEDDDMLYDDFQGSLPPDLQ